jgi:hypothetical protein
VTSRSAFGKAAWQRRAPRFGSELRSRIEQEAAARYAGWQAQGRPPVWFRVKAVVWAAWVKMTERAR